MSIRWAIDLDGCLADFNSAYIDLIASMTDTVLPAVSDTYPATWDYAEAAGVASSDLDRVWSHIQHSDFWLRLRPLPHAEPALVALAERAAMGDHVYFITSRPGVMAKQDTELWLAKHGHMDFPTVMIVPHPSRKPALVKALDITAFIDDKPETCSAVASMRMKVPSKVFIVDAPHNRAQYDVLLTRGGVRRTSSVLDFIHTVIAEERRSEII